MNGLMAIQRYASGGPTFPADLGSYSGLQKAEVYNNLLKDYSESQIRAAADKQFGKQSDSDWNQLTSYADNLKTLESIYQDIFERPLDPEGRDYWGARIEGLPKSEIFQLVAGGAQAADKARLDPNEAATSSVKSIFAEQLGRQPTDAEISKYVAAINSGRSTADISREIDRSLEGYNFDAERIEADYRNQFGRTADQEGFQYWMSVEDASAGKVNQDKITDYIKGGAQAQDIAALAERPEAGYGVETPLSLSALIADPYGGRYATDLPYLSKTEIDALFPTSKSEGGAYAAAEGQIGLPQYYMNIRNWFRDNPNATQAQVKEEAKKWGVSDADIQAAVNPEIGLVSKTLAGELIKFTTPVTNQPVQSWFDTKGDFTAQAGPNVLQREDVDAAINRAMASGALDQAGANEIRSGLSAATNWSEAYNALNKPKANVVLNELGVQVGEDVTASEALQEANARKELANAASNLLGGMYPSAVLQGQLAPGMGIDYPFSAEKMQAGYAGTTTKKTLDDIISNLGTDLRLTDQYYQAPASSVPFLRAAYPNVEVQPVGGVGAAGQALLRKSGTYPGLLTDVYRPQLRTDVRRPDGTLVSERPAAGIEELIPLESMTRYGLRPSQEAVAAQAMQPVKPYFDALAAARNVNVTGITPQGATPYSIDPITGRVTFPVSTTSAGTPGANNPASTINFPNNAIDSQLTGKDAVIDQQNQNDSGGKAGGLVLYAGGPVMGSPQYFAEGGEAMTKYTPKDLGSTFDVSEYIDPETGRFMINKYRRDVVFNPELARAEAAARENMAKGGLASAALKGYAEELRQQGRNGDTILAHINPTEAKMLEAMGGSGTINPKTGLPEYGFSWKKLFRVASKIVPFIIPNPITAAVAAGTLAGASTPGKTFDFKRGLQVGLTSYMGAKAGEYIGKEMAARAATDTASKVAGATGPQIGGYGDFTSGQIAGGTQTATSATPTIAQQITSALPDVSQYIPSTVNPTSIGQALGTASAQSAADETIKLRQAEQAIFDEEERKRKAMAQVFQEGSGNIGQLTYGARNGGLIALAGGGAIDPVAFEGGGMNAPVNQPRMLAGGGDGMSDSIPATIDGTQPARLADGEFVIPADVVADIGNGSSSAGAKRLYGMMDRVRTARHGTTKQPPEIKINRLMPA